MLSSSPVLKTPCVSTFLGNLRLLDLDRLEDWPSVSAQVLTSKDAGSNQKARIIHVEWTLYRLFEIWDVNEALNVGLSSSSMMTVQAD